jgi:ATP-dependent protease Clp ATPase subunit
MTAAEQTVVAACSFCFKPAAAVVRLVAGNGVYICNECVALCALLMEGEPTSVPQLATWDHVTSVEAALAMLPRITAAKTQVEENLTGWVRKARALGATWTKIGEALGMTRQSAWERFSGEE